MVYMAGIGFDTLPDILTDLCLTMAFPIFLIGLSFLRTASIALWIFFLAQWINAGFLNSQSHLHISNPHDWFHGDALFIGAVLVSYSAWSLTKGDASNERATLEQFFWVPSEWTTRRVLILAQSHRAKVGIREANASRSGILTSI